MVERSLLVQWAVGSILLGRLIDPFFRSNHCFTTGVSNVMVCTILSVGSYIKDPLLLIEKSSPCSGGSGLPLLPSGHLPYVRRHITVNKMC